MISCSLLIPCYNAEKYLPRLWETVEAQTVPFDEVICYDDGSQDNTVEVAKSLGAKVIVGNKNIGVSHARNQLAKASNCDWIHFHDADDLLHPEYLEKTKAKIDSSIDVIICNTDWVDEETRQLVIAWKYQNQDFKNNPLTSAIANPIGVISGLYRKNKFLMVKGFNENYSCWEDADLHVCLAGSGAKFLVVEEVLAFSLRHSHGLSQNQHKCWHCRFQFLKKYANEFDSSINEVVIEQLEVVTRAFLGLNDKELAFESLKFCQFLGGNPPKTQNILLQSLKSIMPAFWLIQIQDFIRRQSL
jgi:glycosyltransferase involved in cell wall biosynthesis